MIYILAFLFVLSVLVFVHELGHFLAARRIGVRVLTFSLGFGPKLLKMQRGDTEYCISAIPLGGYVKMAGENADEPRSGAPDEFLSKTKWERFQVLIMGPVMNIALAVVVLAGVKAQGYEKPAYLDEPPIVAVVRPGSLAEVAGVRPGDKVLSVARESVSRWDDVELGIGTRAGQEIDLELLRDGQTITVRVKPKPEGRFEFGEIGILPAVNPIVRSTEPNYPAVRAGVKAGDVVLRINGEHIAFAQDLRDIVGKSANREIEMVVRRDGLEIPIRLTPVEEDGRGRIGVTPTEPTKLVKLGPLDAIRESVNENIRSSGLIFRTLRGLFTGETSVKQLQGPVGIAQLSGEAAQISVLSLLGFMAMLSLNLGLLNLMPVPVLDGGHILIMALEGIARRDFSMQAKEKMLLAGFVVLMMLMVTVIYNDLTRISSVERLMPWRN